MRRTGVFVSLAVMMALAACVGSRDRGVGPSPPTRAAPSAPERSESVLPTLVLRADLSEEPAVWRPVLFVPFGPRKEHLGYLPSRESPTYGPSSFAVEPDGSIWILDEAKHRVAHYSRGGRYLGAVTGINRAGRDLVFREGRLYILENPAGLMSIVEADGHRERTVVTEGYRRLIVAELIDSRLGVMAQVAGYILDVAAGPHGPARLALPGSGESELVPGVPVDGGTWVHTETTGDQDIEVRYIDGGDTTVQPIRVHLVTDRPGGGRSIPAVVGPGNFVPIGDDVAMYVMIAAAEGHRREGGRWLLRVSAGSSPLLWERLEEPGRDDDAQVRHLARAPDGGLLLMVTRRDGIAILRREE